MKYNQALRLHAMLNFLILLGVTPSTLTREMANAAAAAVGSVHGALQLGFASKPNRRGYSAPSMYPTPNTQQWNDAAVMSEQEFASKYSGTVAGSKYAANFNAIREVMANR